MTDYVILRKVRLGSEHLPTGRTRHYRGAQVLPVPSALQIARYSEDTGLYLFYLDVEGNEITDTYHDTLEGAVEQARWEFGIEDEDWEVLQEDE